MALCTGHNCIWREECHRTGRCARGASCLMEPSLRYPFGSDFFACHALVGYPRCRFGCILLPSEFFTHFSARPLAHAQRLDKLELNHTSLIWRVDAKRCFSFFPHFLSTNRSICLFMISHLRTLHVGNCGTFRELWEITFSFQAWQRQRLGCEMCT